MKKAILGALGALLVATMACSIFVGGPSYPNGATPAGVESTADVQTELDQALAAATQTGQISVQLTEAQLTSYLAQHLAAEANPLLNEPRVYLHPNDMEVFGTVTQGIFTANVSIALQVSVDSLGQPQVKITRTDFGPLAAPQGLNDAITSIAEETLTGALGPAATGFRLESITIGEGVMTITGRVR